MRSNSPKEYYPSWFIKAVIHKTDLVAIDDDDEHPYWKDFQIILKQAVVIYKKVKPKTYADQQEIVREINNILKPIKQ